MTPPPPLRRHSLWTAPNLKLIKDFIYKTASIEYYACSEVDKKNLLEVSLKRGTDNFHTCRDWILNKKVFSQTLENFLFF